MKNFDEMNRLFREMDRMFDEVRTGWYDASDGRALPIEGGRDAGSTLERIDDEYVFVMDLPGFEREEIDLTFDDGALSVRAVRAVDEDGDGVRAFRSRRVEKEVRVPADVAIEESTARYHNGVLEVHLPIEAADDGGYRIDVE